MYMKHVLQLSSLTHFTIMKAATSSLFPIFKANEPPAPTGTTATTTTMKNIWQALKRDYQLTNRSLYAAYGDQSTIDRLDAFYASDEIKSQTRFVVITNVPIDSEDRIVKLCNDARQGTFHAVLTLHGNLESQERDALEWKTESRYIDDLPDDEMQTEQDLLLAMAAITDSDRYRFKRKSSPDTSSQPQPDDDYGATNTWLNYEQLMEEMDAERRFDDFDHYDPSSSDDEAEEEDEEDGEKNDEIADEDGSKLNNYKSVPKKFVRGGASTQARAYISDLYKQYFSSFYRLVKKTPKREALLVTAKMF